MARSTEELAAETASLEFRSGPIAAREIDRRIQIAISRIENNLGGSHVVTIARSVNLSPSRFRHLFRDEIGSSWGTYIRMVRLRRARKLLLTTFLSVKEITALVGANDVSHFVRDYKTYFGHTPTQDRLKSTERFRDSDVQPAKQPQSVHDYAEAVEQSNDPIRSSVQNERYG